MFSILSICSSYQLDHILCLQCKVKLCQQMQCFKNHINKHSTYPNHTHLLLGNHLDHLWFHNQKSVNHSGNRHSFKVISLQTSSLIQQAKISPNISSPSMCNLIFSQTNFSKFRFLNKYMLPNSPRRKSLNQQIVLLNQNRTK